MAAENPLRIRMTRSSSAPPRMEGSIPTIDEEISVNSSLNDFKNTPKRVKSEEHLPSGPGSISFHKEEASQDLSESSSDATPENNTISSPSCQDSSIDRIQDCSASNTKIGEPAAYDANPITLKSLRVDERSEPSSQSLDHPYQRDESRAKHAKKGCRSASGNIPRVDSVDNLYSKRNHDKHESLKNHVPELRVPMQEYVPNRVHRSPGQTSSHGMLHESFPSENHHFSNPQPFSLYGPQQAYAFCSTFFSPFMTGYSPHSLIPLSSGPSYVGHYLQPACDTSAQASFGAHLVPPKPFHVSYFGDRKFHLPLEGSSNVPAQRKTEISGHGNRPFVNDMTLDSIRIQRTYSDGKRGSNDCDESRLKFSFLEELKSNNGHNFELSDIEGRIVDFSVDQQGSRFIQQKLEHCSDEEKMAVFNEVVPHISRLMVDIFGNFVIQKFLELGSLEQRKELAEKLSGKMLSLSLQEFGCRVIQKALQVVNLEQKLLLAKELDGHAMKCARDQNGNHVIQKCIECLPTQETGFIISSFKGHVPELASHPYGCRVIQTILERYSDDTQRRFIVNEILESAWFLSRDQFGNYVIQYILKRGKPDERSQIIDKLARKVVDTSRHKYASHVVEQCLEYGNTKEQELLIEEILELSNGEDNLLAMMKDQYANYVVQKAFKIGNERQREALIHRARVHLRALRKSVFGKHIVAFCEGNSVYDRE